MGLRSHQWTINKTRQLLQWDWLFNDTKINTDKMNFWSWVKWILRITIHHWEDPIFLLAFITTWSLVKNAPDLNLEQAMTKRPRIGQLKNPISFQSIKVFIYFKYQVDEICKNNKWKMPFLNSSQFPLTSVTFAVATMSWSTYGPHAIM